MINSTRSSATVWKHGVFYYGGPRVPTFVQRPGTPPWHYIDTTPAAILENIERPYLGNGSSDRFIFGSRVGFSRSADRMLYPLAGRSRSADRMALLPVGSNPRWRPAAILENFERSYLGNGSSDPFHLCSRVGFSGRRIECLYFRLDQIQDHGRQLSCIIFNGHISETVHPVQFVFVF